MKDIKTKPQIREVKIRDAAALAPKELSKLMKDGAAAKQLRQRECAGEDSTCEHTAVRDAVAEYESITQGVTAYASDRAYTAGKTLAQKRYDRQFRTGKQADHSTVDGQPVDFSGGNTPRITKAKQEYRTAKAKQQQERQKEIKLRTERAENRQTAADLRQGSVSKNSTVGTPERQPQTAFGQITGKTSATIPKKKPPLSSGAAIRSAVARAKAHVTQKMQRQLMQESAKKSAQAVKTTSKGLSRLKDAVIRAGKAIARAAVGLLGGAGGLIALVLVIGGAAAVVGTPFGVFWSGQDADAQSVPQAVATINAEFAAKINQIQAAHPTDSVAIHRVPSGGSDLSITNWVDIVAVFAVKTAGANADATDVVTMDEKRVELLRKIFWDMNAITYSVETVGDGEDSETILHITITSKTAAEMPDIYRFNKSQQQALTEMLKPEYTQMLAELVGTYGGELTLTEEQIREMLSKMPEDLSTDRRAVVETAYSLLGKVDYFWGGKSSAIGWDTRWGAPTKVTAPGSRTTGTIRPYGLDCSGFVDWVFHNALGYVIGHGGGAHAQHNYCIPISWSEALPGDLVFYPGDSHVGVFVGMDEGGNPLIIHCASSQNNVVLTGLQGFKSIARPDYTSS